MKSPYRKGIQITVSNAAIQAAATMIAQVYRGVNDTSHKRIVDLAALIVDEIEARQIVQVERSQPYDSDKKDGEVIEVPPGTFS